MKRFIAALALSITSLSTQAAIITDSLTMGVFKPNAATTGSMTLTYDNHRLLNGTYSATAVTPLSWTITANGNVWTEANTLVTVQPNYFIIYSAIGDLGVQVSPYNDTVYFTYQAPGEAFASSYQGDWRLQHVCLQQIQCLKGTVGVSPGEQIVNVPIAPSSALFAGGLALFGLRRLRKLYLRFLASACSRASALFCQISKNGAFLRIF